MVSSKKIIDLARETLGTPYHHQGRVNQVGLDCIGVLEYVANNLGVEYIDGQNYSKFPHDGLLEYAIGLQGCMTQVFEKQPGDVFLMRFQKETQHVAIFTGDTIIHSYESIGRVVEHSLDDVWEKRITHIFRFTGVEV